MKVGNKLLNRIVAVGTLAVILFGGLSFVKPETAYADGTLDLPEYDFRYNNLENENYFDLYKWDSSCIGDTVSFWNAEKQSFSTAIISTSPLKASYTEYDYRGKYGGGFELDDKGVYTSHSGHFETSDKTYYYVWYSMTTSGGHFGYQVKKGICFSSKDFHADNAEKYIHEYILKTLPESFVVIGGGGVDTSKIPDGSQNNPYKKDNFGYPRIFNSTYIHNDPDNLETLDKLYSGQDFQWKKKTTTGFDLTNNDYNYTYIECKVKANYQYNDKFSGKGSWHDFASYGEMGNLGKVRAESLSHYYTFQEFQEALPKTSNELPDHKMRAIKSSAVYYFRVVCMKTSSTVVIPDEKDCKYYAGPWRSITVTKINGKDGTSIIEDGDLDENGEWKKDDSSNDNGKDIDNGSAEGDDLSDASDKAHETINSNANKSTLDLDSAKAFINQVADVPKMIADIFSFLPDWVKYSFAFGFALIPILIIFKLIRG